MVKRKVYKVNGLCKRLVAKGIYISNSILIHMANCKENRNFNIVKAALEDRVVEGLKVINPTSKDAVRNLLDSEKGDFYLGEWRSELGRITYSYRIHSPETADNLNALKNEGYAFSKPKLIKLYGRKELLEYVKNEAA